jgi:hypothetical protein
VNAVAVPAMTKSRAKQIAKAVQLTSTDMLGYDEAPPDNPSDPRGDARLSKCAGTVPDSKSLADVSSDSFSRTVSSRYEQVNSEAVVYPTSALVRRDMKASQSARARQCLAKQLRGQSTGDPNQKLVSVSVKALKPGLRNGVALRVKSVYQTPNGMVTLYTDALIAGIGPVEAGVVAVSGPAPAPRSEENRLLKIVSARVKRRLRSSASV